MKTFIEAIRTAEAAKGKGSKQIKEEAIGSFDETGKKLVHEAMSPYRVFGIKKFDLPNTFSEEDDSPHVFFDLLDKLHDRDITGHAAKKAVTETLSKYTQDTAEILIRILKKDLKAGFSAETVNKVLTGQKKPKENPVVPLFGVMLAEKLDEKRYKWKYPLLAEAKYDGNRAIAICDNGEVNYFSRSGKPADHLDGLFDSEISELEKIAGEPIVLDGEALASSFTETQNARGSKNTAAKANMKFYVFDYMTLDEWINEQTIHSQITRSEILEGLIKQLANNVADGDVDALKLIKSQYKVCDDYEEVYGFYVEMLEQGYEGLILKNPDALYEWDRSKAWVKWKPVFTFDGKIVDFYSGQEGTRLENSLGGIIVEGVDENGNEFTTECGSGFTDGERDVIWESRKVYLGRMVELEAQEMCKGENSDKYSLRFPVFKKFRRDKD